MALVSNPTALEVNMDQQLAAAQQTLATLPKHLPVLREVAKAMVQSLREGHAVLTCGNGGSCAEAQHLVTELIGRYDRDRRGLPAVYLGGDVGLMTSVANDFSWEETFTRPLEVFGKPGDILVCFTTSGNSPNVLAALKRASSMGLQTLAFLGKSGGACRGLATWEVVIDCQSTARVQEAHLFLIHWLCDQIDEAFCVKG
jgi:D-sedoheptulose 7-phosphate isomerase